MRENGVPVKAVGGSVLDGGHAGWQRGVGLGDGWV